MCMYVCLTARHASFLFCSVRKLYLKDQFNYVQLTAAVLPLLIIPFRAATTWCASTGDGYCVDPTLLNTSNTTHFILDINHACISASSVQWIIASLAYMVNAMLVLEFLTLSRYYIASHSIGYQCRTLKYTMYVCVPLSLSLIAGGWECMWRSSKGWL